MANDAKLGLVLGVALVVVIGLVNFRGEPAGARVPTEQVRAITKAPPTPQAHIASR